MSMVKRTRFVKTLTIMGVLLIFLVSFVCFITFSHVEKKKSLIIGRKNDVVSLDPAIVTDAESFQVTSNIFETLVNTDMNGVNIIPGIAESWQISEDGLTFVFKIRKGILFHDNTPLNAKAIEFNFNRWMNKDSPYHIGDFAYWNQTFGGDFKKIKSVTAISEFSLEIVLFEPYTPFLKALSVPAFGIASPDAIMKHNENFEYHPIGSGPFQFETWIKDDSIILIRNDQYWQGKASLHKAIFKTIAEEEDYMVGLSTGNMHIMNQLTVNDIEQAKKIDSIEVRYLPFLNTAYLGLNNRNKPFDQVMVRQAIARLIDKDEIIDEAFDELSRSAYSFLPPTFFGYQEGLDADIYSVEEAKELLAQSGFSDGFKTSLWVMKQPRSYYTKPVEVAQYIKEKLALAGIEVTIRVFDWEEYLEALDEGQHDMILVGWHGDFADPDNFLYTMFASRGINDQIGLNYSYYSNDRVDFLLRQARRVVDSKFRINIYKEIQRILYQEVASIPLAHTVTGIGVNRDVIGFEPHISGNINLYQIDLKIDANEEATKH